MNEIGFCECAGRMELYYDGLQSYSDRLAQLV